MNFKQQSAIAAVKLIKPNQIVGLGAGSTIAYLVQELAKDSKTETLSFVSSSQETTELLLQLGMKVLNAENISSIDVYFDGCDFLDKDLNALKSGGGIHTDEKILASMAKEFILLGDTQKYIQQFDKNCSFTIEVVTDSIGFVIEKLQNQFDIESVTIRKDSNQEKILTKRFGALLDVKFHTFPEFEILNNIKLWAGIIEHSLFYKLATQAILCGSEGTIHLTQPKV